MIMSRTVRTVACILFSLSAVMAQTVTSRIVSAANAFLSTLDQKQRQTVLFSFNDDEQRAVRPLAQESDKAMALLNALDEGQRKQAVLSYRLADLVLGPGKDGKTIQPEGLKASAMNEKQRAMLLDVISEWAGIVHESSAAARMAELKADVDETWFAWSGPTTVTPGSNITAYYRIQGPHLVIEYAPQRLGSDPALHVHTMYRDPTNDYGRKYTAK